MLRYALKVVPFKEVVKPHGITIVLVVKLLKEGKMNEPTENFIATFQSLMKNGDKQQAESLLKKSVAEMPHNWKPIGESPDVLSMAFWNQEEFLMFIAHHEKSNRYKKLLWIAPSYSRAFYYLSFIAVGRQDWSQALKYINEALTLEPDHPLSLCEKATILSNGMNDKEEALKLFMKAIIVRPWSPNTYIAKAMRGAAIILIDLKKFEEAKKLLEESLNIEPESKVAKHELNYIKQLLSGATPTSKWKVWRSGSW